MDYKDTLLLPKTSFPMRGNLPQNEPKRYKKWSEEDVYKKMQQNRSSSKENFNLHDGPPYANGNIHIGHALNKTLKDIIVKTNYYSGKNIFYRPGWDCHGLPIEQQVEKKMGRAKKESLPKEKFRELCRNHAAKFIDIQRDEFKELGVIGLWDEPYKTMDFKFEADIFRALADIAKSGLLVERSKPVYWSWACTTALAEAEVEYEEKESDSIYVAFPLQSDALSVLECEEASMVIWTTTPWTLPANVAISINPEEEYVITDSNLIVAKKLFENLKDKGVLEGSIKRIFTASILQNKKATNPLNNRDSIIITGDHVSVEDGTGCVHTAPGHGEDDYVIGLKYNLPVVMPVDVFGKYDRTIEDMKLLPNASKFVGMHIFDANAEILDLLGSALISHSKFTHSYPHCWRSHEPVIFRATKQWFILLDKKMSNGKTLRQNALEEIERVRFYPPQGRNRLKSMIENRPDWCVSRQRDWGVPIAFFRNKQNGEILLDESILQKTALIFEKEGADAWWSKDVAYFLEGSGFDAELYEKVDDILDVWFDSGSTWKAVLQERPDISGSYPANMYLEGSDQHRGWFQSSLLVSCAINHHAPYDSIVTHGFTNDENGQKMSKSKGNVVAPKDVLKKYGSEILRLWVAMSDYQSDQKISENILKQISENYRKARNTIRFLMASIEDLDEVVELEKLGLLDRWILSLAKETFDRVEELFLEYEFSKGFHALNEFVVTELSGIYLDICKDRLYCEALDSTKRRASQSTMYLILKSLLGLYAPIITYTVDEALENAPSILNKTTNDVFDLEFTKLPLLKSEFNSDYLLRVRDSFFEAVDELKKAKQISNTLELEIVTNDLMLLKDSEIEDWFLVSSRDEYSKEGEYLASFEIDGNTFAISKTTKHKCPRCWRFSAESENGLCQRCKE
ncbi:MAG: isoleucine--tRNA ligase, partial [Campylobacterales bacterium]